MSELLPSREAARIRTSLVDYLTTTFALSDAEAQHSLQGFLNDPDEGIFRGPYARVRVPFRAATEGWRDELGWYEGYTPYGHQAEAFRRLSSANYGTQPDGTEKDRTAADARRDRHGIGQDRGLPLPDSRPRATRAGRGRHRRESADPVPDERARQRPGATHRGHDHRARRASAASAPPCTRAKGQTGPTKVAGDRLISDRTTIRTNPPDILLTNYKMLDQLLLRAPDQPADRRDGDEPPVPRAR